MAASGALLAAAGIYLFSRIPLHGSYPPNLLPGLLLMSFGLGAVFVSVTTAADGPRLLIEDGVSGLLTPLEDPGALAGAIRHALGDPKASARMAKAGHKRYQQDFTKAAVVGQYRAFFERILA